MIQVAGELGRSLISAFWGLLIPGAEWIVPWYKYRKISPANRNSLVDRHIRFQRNWFLLRIFVLAVSGVWAAQIVYAPSAKHFVAKDESAFSIPGETQSDTESVQTEVPHRSGTFQITRKSTDDREDIEIRREYIGSTDPNVVLTILLGIFVSVTLWMMSMMLTLINVFRVSSDRSPYFPLTLKKKG